MSMDKHYAGISNALGFQQAGENAPRQQPMVSLYEAMNYLRESAAMARNTADQLCGSQPEAIGKEAPPKGGSYFSQIEDVAEEVKGLSRSAS